MTALTGSMAAGEHSSRVRPFGHFSRTTSASFQFVNPETWQLSYSNDRLSSPYSLFGIPGLIFLLAVCLFMGGAWIGYRTGSNNSVADVTSIPVKKDISPEYPKEEEVIKSRKPEKLPEVVSPNNPEKIQKAPPVQGLSQLDIKCSKQTKVHIRNVGVFVAQARSVFSKKLETGDYTITLRRNGKLVSMMFVRLRPNEVTRLPCRR